MKIICIKKIMAIELLQIAVSIRGGNPMSERKWKKIHACVLAWMMAVMFTVSGTRTVFAAASYVSSVSITLDVAPTVGESLPDLEVGYNSDNCEVSIPDNDKYDIVSAKWSSSKADVKVGGTYTLKVTLKTLNDYRFSSSSYTSSKVRVKNGTFVSASRTSSDRLVVTVKTKPTKGDLDAPGEAYWISEKSGSSDLGIAKWEAVEDASYEAYLYRGNKVVYKSGELHVSNYDFFPYMTSKGTYTFKVRSLPSNDEMSKYASKSEWTLSDEVYIDEEDAERAVKEKISDSNNTNSGNNSGNSRQPPSDTNAVGWIRDEDRWYYRYPDGTYLKNGWGYIGSVWYLFDANGMMLTGWQMKNGVYYYMNGDGMMQTGWLAYNNVWYYLTDSGAMATGWITLGDKTYYLGGDGAMLTGWQTIDGQIYYLYPDGHRASNEVIDTFYVDQNGVWKKPQ